MKEERRQAFLLKQDEFDNRVLNFIQEWSDLSDWSKALEISYCDDVGIAVYFEISTRTARKSIQRLRKTHIIWNFQDGRGYIIGETDTEEGNRLNDLWLNQEDSRAIQNFAHSKYARSRRKNPNQMDMYINKLTDEQYEEEKQC